MAFPPNFKKGKKDPALDDAMDTAAEAKGKFPPKGKKGKFGKKKKKGNPFKSLPGGPKDAKGQLSGLEQM